MIFKTHEQISLLPKPPPKNALNEVAKLIKDFDADIQRNIQGVPFKEGIIQRIRVPTEQFRRTIRGTAPEFRPFNQSASGDRGLPDPEFLKHEEDVIAQEGGDSDVEDNEIGLGLGVNRLIYADEVHRRMAEYVFCCILNLDWFVDSGA